MTDAEQFVNLFPTYKSVLSEAVRAGDDDVIIAIENLIEMVERYDAKTNHGDQ